uniref:Transmembrane BAX inhibitor motif-containing protein 4 n=1 Tax=Phaeocystis antarctica TaxID=33657 RepID=A0A7S0HSF5_9EUKA|mmetsp:Transcript_30581/g.72091  ORF Transcript_30581/g.72091 Transcript_30581/m.72091 type:complete len:268 (+) Transcript_30581:69-872(+)
MQSASQYQGGGSSSQYPTEGNYSGKPSSNYADLEADQVVMAREVANCSAEVRAGFIRKVYGILSMQLLLTVVGAATFMFVESARSFALSSTGVFYTALFMPFPVLFALFCYKNKHPVNMYLLTLFTVCEAYTVGVICAVYYEQGYGEIVLQALLLTAAVFISLTSYVFVTKKDFSWMGGALYMGLIILLVWGFINMLFPIGGGLGRAVFSLMGALLFSGYILYDTSVIMLHMGPDDYIMASVSLYLDIINLFLYLLEILRFMQGGSD